jgi:uncharacterized protein (DUF2141 family)
MSLPRRFRATVAVAAALSGLALLAVPAAAPAADGRPVPPPGCTGPASATWLNVTVEGLRNSNGQIAVTLYADNPRKFLVRHGSIYVGRAPAQANSMRTCIFVPQPGVYVLALYHDENGNQKFDRTGIGLPAEGYGFSNNPSTLAGLPSFRSVRLAVPSSGLATRVHMKYP